MTLAQLGVGLTEISVVLGFATAGFAFTIRETLASWLAGLVLLFKRPFRCEDCIGVEGISGRGERIGTFFVTIDTGLLLGKRGLARLPVRLLIEKPLVNYGPGGRVPVELALPLTGVPADSGKRLTALRRGLEHLPDRPALTGLAFVFGENSCRRSATFLIPLERRVDAQAALLDQLVKTFRGMVRG